RAAVAWRHGDGPTGSAIGGVPTDGAGKQTCRTPFTGGCRKARSRMKELSSTYLSALMAQLPEEETVVFEDEVDVHLNPKSGSCWMPRGEQRRVVTPGTNEQRHLAGSLPWRTGTRLLSEPGRQRQAALFVAHLEDLRCRCRR